MEINIKGKTNGTSLANSPVVRAKTDAHGIATFDFMPERLEQASFSVVSELFVPEFRPTAFSSTDFEREVTVRVLRKVSIAGRVVGADGQPAAGILLLISGRPLRNGSFLTNGPLARTRADGTFRFEQMPDMSCMIAVIDERWAAVSKTGIVTHDGRPVEGIELRLIPGTLTHGRVTIGPEQQPSVGQEVVLSEQGPFVNAPARLEVAHRTLTDLQGHYQLRVGPGEYLLSVPPGNLGPRVSSR